MDYGNILYLTNFIKNDVTDRDEELRIIYEKAVKESDSYIELWQMKQVLNFFDNGIGARLYRECNTLLSSIFSDPVKGPEILQKMRILVSDIQAEEERSMDVLESFGKLGEGISVISKDVSVLYGEVLNILVHSIIYFLLVSGGENSIKTLRWNDDNSLNVKLSIFNNEILERLNDCESDVFFWKIEIEKDENKIKFSDVRYTLKYISYDDYNDYRKHMKKLRANLYADSEINEKNNHKVLYVGMGNIVACDVDDLINRLKDNCNMVVHPQTVCDLMNQAENTRVIYDRKRMGKCLFCGKDVEGKMVCDNHFKIERIS